MSPSFTCGASFEPNETSMYLSPSNPSDLIDARESVFTMLRVDRSTFITTTTFPSGRSGSWSVCTVPLAIPPTRTLAPSTSPATLSKVAFTWYVGRNIISVLPIRKIPVARMASVNAMNKPRRNSRDISHLCGVVQIPGDKLVAAPLELLVSSLRYDPAFVQHHQPVGEGPGAVKVMRHHDG